MRWKRQPGIFLCILSGMLGGIPCHANDDGMLAVLPDAVSTGNLAVSSAPDKDYTDGWPGREVPVSDVVREQPLNVHVPEGIRCPHQMGRLQEALGRRIIMERPLAVEQMQIDRLLRFMQSEKAAYRATALRTVLRYEDVRIPSHVLALLTDDDRDVRKAAIVACAHFKMREAVPVLIRCLSTEHWWLQLRTQAALHTITGRDFGTDAAAWRRWWEDDTLKRTLKQVGMQSTKQALTIWPLDVD